MRLNNKSYSPVKEFIKKNFKSRLTEKPAISSSRSPQNNTYELKKKNKMIEKLVEERMKQKQEKLRDLKRLKRRKELQKQLESNLKRKFHSLLSNLKFI